MEIKFECTKREKSRKTMKQIKKEIREIKPRISDICSKTLFGGFYLVGFFVMSIYHDMFLLPHVSLPLNLLYLFVMPVFFSLLVTCIIYIPYCLSFYKTKYLLFSTSSPTMFFKELKKQHHFSYKRVIAEYENWVLRYHQLQKKKIIAYQVHAESIDLIENLPDGNVACHSFPCRVTYNTNCNEDIILYDKDGLKILRPFIIPKIQKGEGSYDTMAKK